MINILLLGKRTHTQQLADVLVNVPGYSVVEANTSREARQLFDRFPNSFDLVIADIDSTRGSRVGIPGRPAADGVRLYPSLSSRRTRIAWSMPFVLGLRAIWCDHSRRNIWLRPCVGRWRPIIRFRRWSMLPGHSRCILRFNRFPCQPRPDYDPQPSCRSFTQQGDGAF